MAFKSGLKISCLLLTFFGGFFFLIAPMAHATVWSLDEAAYQATSNFTKDKANGLYFKSDGTVLYVAGGDVPDSVTQYNLSTPWNVSTASNNGSYTFSNDGNYWVSDIVISSDGTKLWFLEGTINEDIVEYSMSTPWDITTLSETGDTFNVGAVDSEAEGLFFKPDGTKMYMIGNSGDRVYQFSMDPAWDITSLSYDSVNISSQTSSASGVFFSDDGTKMFTTGSSADNVYQFTLSSAWDLSTAFYDSVSYGVRPTYYYTTGIFIGNSGANLYHTDWSYDRVYQHELADITNPGISILSPADNSSTHPRNNNISITFNETVYSGSGYISLYKTEGDTLIEQFDVTSDISGDESSTITIDPTEFLLSETSYYIQIDATAFDDDSGNSFAGIADATTWNFTTEEDTLPIISSLSPVDDAPLVPLNSNLIITFNEVVDAETGDITIYKSDDTLVEQIDVTSGQVTGSGSTTIVVNPSSNLTGSTDYYVQIDTTAFDDATDNSFAGIADKTTWTFSTVTAPILCAIPSFTEVSVDESVGIDVARVADLDADGDFDIISAGPYGSDWYTNDGSENFTDNIDIGSSTDGTDMIVIDVDSDGDLDVVVSDRDASTIKWLDNDGSENFTSKTVGSAGGNAYGVYADDVDNDGDIDVLSTSMSDSRVYWFRNNGSQGFTRYTLDSSNDGAYAVMSADFDGDGDKDVVAIGASINGTTSFYRNNGGTSFSETVLYSTSEGDVYIADVNSDGELDIVTTDWYTVTWYENDGSENFTRHLITNSASTSYNEVMAMDMNGDSYTDIVVADYDGGVVMYQNDGNENFTERFLRSTNGSYTLRSIELADLNNDGYMDIILPENGLNDVIWMRGGCDASAPLVQTLSPVNEATDVSLSSDLVITFDESVNAGMGSITLYKSDGTEIEVFDVTADISGSGSDTITIDPSSIFEELTSYYVQIDATAFDDIAGNDFAGIADDSTWAFTSGDEAPLVSSFSPTDDSTNVSAFSNLAITFNEAVYAQSGNISLYKSGGILVQAFDVTSDISGSGTSTITINPTLPLDSDTEHYIQIDATAFDDASGNSFAGITDETTWNFIAVKASQTITFNSIDNKAANDAPFDLAATASSGLTVSYTSSDTDVATVSGATVTIVGEGTTTITASQIGNYAYAAAVEVEQDLTVGVANPVSSSIVAESIDSEGVTITWTSDLQASTQVEYALNESLNNSVSTTEADTDPRVTSHSVNLSSLAACTRYYYRVKSTGSQSNQGISSVSNFKTTGCVAEAEVVNEEVTDDTVDLVTGGTVSLLDVNSKGTTLTIPDGYHTSATYFQINQLNDDTVISSAPAPSGYNPVSDLIFEYKSLENPTTEVTTFLKILQSLCLIGIRM